MQNNQQNQQNHQIIQTANGPRIIVNFLPTGVGQQNLQPETQQFNGPGQAPQQPPRYTYRWPQDQQFQQPVRPQFQPQRIIRVQIPQPNSQHIQHRPFHQPPQQAAPQLAFQQPLRQQAVVNKSL